MISHTPSNSSVTALDPITSTFPASAFEPATRDGSAQTLSRPSLSYWSDAWLRLKKNKQALTSLWIIIGLLLFTTVGPVLWTTPPAEQNLLRIAETPNLGVTIPVVAPLEEYQEVVVSEHLPAPADPTAVQASSLTAPQNVTVTGEAITQGVRLRWDPVLNADSYVIYRSLYEPWGDRYGVPMGETDAGNKVSYQDQFDLKGRTYYYTVVPRVNFEEGPKGSTLAVTVSPSASVTEAQTLSPSLQAGEKLQLPARPLGTDYLGRDLLSRIMQGARVSLFIGFVAPLLSVAFGIVIGGIAGYFGGRIDAVLMRITDFVLALPFLLFMILFKIVLGAAPGENGILPMLVSMIALSWTGSARLTRGQILQLRESEFVQASRLMGAKPLYLIFRHLLPNTLGVILVSLTFAIPSAIFTEAFLSFIGMGVQPPTASWGSLCFEGLSSLEATPHQFLFPAVFISITVLAFNLLGDGLRDALDPKMRSLS